jgi:hypothetical protein
MCTDENVVCFSFFQFLSEEVEMVIETESYDISCVWTRVSVIELKSSMELNNFSIDIRFGDTKESNEKESKKTKGYLKALARDVGFKTFSFIF